MTTQSGFFLFFRTYIMEISYLLLMLLMVPANVVGQPLRQVISQSSTELKTSFDNGNVKDLIWTLKTQQEDYPIQIIKIQNGRVVENLSNRYKLSHNGTVLGINNLTKCDSGNYTAVVTMWDNLMKEENFDLTVVDPVPTPKIQHEVERSGDQCYITLNCSVSSNRDSFSYSWKYRTRDSKYHDINMTVNIIQSRPLDPQDTEFMCIVQNQADQKNVTAHIKYCSEPNTTVIVMAVVVMVVVVMVAVLMWRHKNKSSDPSEQDDQKVEEGENYKNKNEENKDDQEEGEADEDENKENEPKNQNGHQNEDNLNCPVPEIGVQCREPAGEQIPSAEVCVIHIVTLNKRSRTYYQKEKVEEEENYKSKNEENKDGQAEGQADEDENKVKEHENQNEHQNEDNLRHPVPEIGVRCREPAGQQIPPAEVCAIHIVSLNKRPSTSSTGYHKVWSIPVYKNEVKKHNKEDEHLNKDENRENQLQDTRKHRMWATVTYENEVKKYKKDEHWNKEENREMQLQETSYRDSRVRKNEEHEKKDDDENDEGHPFLEERDATRASKTRSTDREQPYMKSSVSQRL